MDRSRPARMVRISERMSAARPLDTVVDPQHELGERGDAADWQRGLVHQVATDKPPPLDPQPIRAVEERGCSNPVDQREIVVRHPEADDSPVARGVCGFVVEPALESSLPSTIPRNGTSWKVLVAGIQ